MDFKEKNLTGSTLYEQALEKGAIACVLQGIELQEEITKKYPHATIVLVENTTKAIQKLATYKRSLYHIPVVAITGSVGKTSTKDMVASVIAQKYKVLKTQGNYNNEIGLPLTVLDLKDEEIMVLEMGMNSFGEISILTQIAKPDIAVITNIGTAHIGMLGSRDNILKAKLEILEGLNPKGTVIVNYDNDLLHNWYEKEKANYQILTYGLQEGSTILGKNAIFEENGSKCEAILENQTYEVSIPVGGEHFISNSLCALSVAKALEIPIEKALKGIEKFELTKKRMEMKKSKNGATIVNDCYNANYDSMKAALDYVGRLPDKRKIAVLGDMLELGEYSKELHEKVGKEVVNNKIDILICVGEEVKHLIEQTKREGMEETRIFLCKSNEEAIDILKKELKPEDVVLLKASNSLNFTQICEAIV
ncbi:MAG: UDP-N-acetylmuramoyl-tripeptide--D-alanyl-D-alanine ligase [Clostridia bacterium]|nr:UDP-N-acetylmuramoyl-tripeptide--D-alanyl-D-alanine ligase [Clostridia bacterium]